MTSRIPAGWTRRPIGELLTVQYGYAFKSGQFVKPSEGGMPLIRIRDLKAGDGTVANFVGDYDPKYVVSAGDLLIGMDGEFRCYKWRGPDALLNQRVCRLQSFVDGVDPEFIRFGINDRLQEIENNTRYSTVKHISGKQIRAIEMAFPSLAEQRRIVARIREALNRVREIRCLRDESLKDAARVEEAVFADFVEGLGGEVPTVSLGDALTESQYGTSKKANTEGRGVPCLRMPNIKDGHLVIDDLKHVELTQKELDKWTLEAGDVLINRTNSLELVGKAATFNLEGGPWVSASYLVRLKVDRTRALPEYITAVINSRIGRSYVYRTARRAIGMVNINSKEIKAMPIPLPEIDQQRAVIERMESAHRACVALKEQLDRTAIHSLPGAILRKAFAGEL